MRFEVASAQTFDGGPYDLVTTFDSLHDMGDPLGAARHIREMLAPDGTWMVIEPYQFSDGVLELWTVRDPSGLDQRRAELGLEPEAANRARLLAAEGLGGGQHDDEATARSAEKS